MRLCLVKKIVRQMLLFSNLSKLSTGLSFCNGKTLSERIHFCKDKTKSKTTKHVFILYKNIFKSMILKHHKNLENC